MTDFSPEPILPALTKASPLEAGGSWQSAALGEMAQWMNELETAPQEIGAAPSEPDAPDLYRFFEQLSILNTEQKRNNRRVAETFSQWGDSLNDYRNDLRQMRESLSALTPASVPKLDRAHGLVLVEMMDRLQRLSIAFRSTPQARWWQNDAPWLQAWERQRQAVEILMSHLEEFLKKEGASRLEILHKPYDPLLMVALAREESATHPHLTVIEELSGGYLWQGQLLRAAQVKISVSPAAAC